MPWRYASIVLCSLALMLAAGAATADPTFMFLRSSEDPANFESQLRACVSQFKTASGLPAGVVDQLNDARIVVYYQKDSAGVDDPNPGGDPEGKLLYLYWDSNLGGSYEDDAPKVPCAALLNGLQYASRYFTGKACTGPQEKNQAAYQHDVKLGARAENWWLDSKDLKQRTSYRFSGKQLPLERWTRWPASPASPVPPAPDCNRSCPAPGLASAAASSSDPAAAGSCQRCTRFQQPGCVDFSGGIYSGGDHRRVANGSLRIIVGDLGYCQGRKPCEFKSCVTCPHLDTAFPKGVTVTAIASAGKDSKFARWGPGACKGQGPTCTFVAKKKSCISAQFLLTNPTAPPQSLPTVPCRP